jgi:hypothetical protein
VATPPRLAPFLAQWDYMLGVLLERLAGLTDGARFMTKGLAAGRSGLDQMTDADLDTVGRAAQRSVAQGSVGKVGAPTS